MIARLLSTARSAVYFWVLAHVEGRHDPADDIVPGMVRHQGLMRATHPHEARLAKELASTLGLDQPRDEFFSQRRREATWQPLTRPYTADGHVEICVRCRKPARGWANIHGQRYCHTYDQGFPDCYTLALHEGVHRRTTGTTKGAETP